MFNKVSQYLYIGDRGAVKNQDKVRKAGITAVVRLDDAPRELGQWDDDFTLLDMPFTDGDSIPNATIPTVTKFIHEQIEAEKSVLVHCERGISCSVSLLMAYLIEYEAMSIAQAFCAIKAVRPIAEPHPKLLLSLLQYYDLSYDKFANKDAEFWKSLLSNCD